MAQDFRGEGAENSSIFSGRFQEWVGKGCSGTNNEEHSGLGLP